MSAPNSDSRIGISALLAELALEAKQTPLSLGQLTDRFEHRGFGLLLLLVAIPTFIPLPVGVVTGPVSILIGLQLLLCRSHPWLPQSMRRRPVSAARLQDFLQRRGHWLQRLERLAHPRWPMLAQSAAGQAASGLLIVVTGLLLSLPIPFTNMGFGVLLLVYALALLERDGWLLALAWTLSLASLFGVILLSHQVVDAIRSIIA